MTPAEHFREAGRLLVEAESAMRETPPEDGSSYKDRRAGRLLQLAKVHALLAQVPSSVAVDAMHLPDPMKPRRPLAPGALEGAVRDGLFRPGGPVGRPGGPR